MKRILFLVLLLIGEWLNREAYVLKITNVL